MHARLVNKIMELGFGKWLMTYLENNSIHGLKYILEPGRHWTERVFWTIICSLSIYLTINLVRASWIVYQTDAISFVVDTSYLNWNTSFPAVTLCEQRNEEKIIKASLELFGEKRSLDADTFLEEIVYFSPLMCGTCSQICGSKINCSINFQEAMARVRATCTQLIEYCAWNDRQFDCCDHFAALETEVGTCYTINSLHSSTGNPPLYMISNRHTGPGKLELQLLENTQVYLHGADEVPFINHPLEEQFTVELGQAVIAIFLIREIENDPFLESVSVEQRACRWARNENFLSTHALYSYSTCIVDCRARAQMEMCSCVSQFMPRMGGFPACDLNGLICLQENKENFNNLRLNTSNAKGLVCDCMASCDEPEINIVETLYEGEKFDWKDRYMDRDWPNGTGINSRITIKMESLPMEQYIRKLVRSPLELIVSIGGIIGLFLGLSMIDVIEMIHYICIKGNPYINCR